jgi:hypothetical protein
MIALVLYLAKKRKKNQQTNKGRNTEKEILSFMFICLLV